MGKTVEKDKLDAVINCPKCKKPMKAHYIFWVDPLWECTTAGCKMSTHKHRESKLKEVSKQCVSR